jgi:protein SCO1/2
VLLSLDLLSPAMRATNACRACAAAESKPLEVTAAAPKSTDRSIYQLDAPWTTDVGQPFKLAELHGRPVVLAMFFTSCGYACPRIVSDMTQIEQSLPPAARDQAVFVLVSFDDVRDTVAALRTYRDQHGLDARRWVLLRGAPGDIRELAAVLGVKYKKDAAGLFSHSNLITILNREGEIVHQRIGLEGGLSEAARAVVVSH